MAKNKEEQKQEVKNKTQPKHKFSNTKPDLIEEPKKAATGRPTKFNPTIAKKVCELIAKGNSLLTIEKKAGMPTRGTIMNWYYSLKYPNFNKLYDEARERRAEYIFEEAINIADDAPDEIVGDDKSDGARIQAQKLRIDTRRWFVGILAPRKFAESSKVDVTTGGKKLKEPSPVTINYVVPK